MRISSLSCRGIVRETCLAVSLSSAFRHRRFCRKQEVIWQQLRCTGDQKCRLTDKPGSVATRLTESPTVISLGRRLLAASSDLPESRTKRSRFVAQQAGPSLCLIVLRAGFTKPHKSPCTLVGSYPTVSPLPHALPRVAVYSLWHGP